MRYGNNPTRLLERPTKSPRGRVLQISSNDGSYRHLMKISVCNSAVLRDAIDVNG
jgi:hypothetical protein